MDREYLVSYGNAGDFGRFRAPSLLRRGDPVVVRSPRGLELGSVLCPAGPGHARLLAQVAVGELLRVAGPEDWNSAERLRKRGQALFADARQTAADLGLPLEILDVEVLLDGRQAVLYHLKATDCDPRELMDRLSERHRLLISLRDLALPAEVHEPATDHDLAGCGAEGCGSGSCGSGGCGSCGAGGCATCGSHSAARFVPPPAAEPAPGRVPLFST